MPLTETAIKKAEPTGKVQRLFDGGGMYLELSPAGGKLWRLKYRFGGKEKRLAMGIYPDVSLKLARDRRDEVRKLIAAGIDPSESKKATKVADSGADGFEAVAREWHVKFAPTWAPEHAERVLRRLEVDVFP